MKKLTSLLVLLGLFAMPAFAMVASYENVPVVDVNCSKKAAAMAFHVGRMTNQRLWEQNCCERRQASGSKMR